jgi:hypothetical protein
LEERGTDVLNTDTKQTFWTQTQNRLAFWISWSSQDNNMKISWFHTFVVFWILHAFFWVIQTPGNYPEECIQQYEDYLLPKRSWTMFVICTSVYRTNVNHSASGPHSCT